MRVSSTYSIMASLSSPFLVSLEGLIAFATYYSYYAQDPFLPHLLNLDIICSHTDAYPLLYHSHQCKKCCYFNVVASTYLCPTSIPLKQHL